MRARIEPMVGSAMSREQYDDVGALAELVVGAPRPLLIGLDVDGVLAPIVSHPDESALTSGVREIIESIASCHDVHVAVVSGRSIADLERFDFPGSVARVGSHGMELVGRAIRPLDALEQQRLDMLDALATAAAAGAGDGAWVERKPASVVLHVRQAPPERSRPAIADLRQQARAIEGATVKDGSAVLELFARSANKGDALVRLASETGCATTAFVGDDVTDEEAFAALAPSDVTIKVGDADTVAAHRLRDPDAVAEWLASIARKLLD